MQFSTRLPIAVHILMAISQFSGSCRVTSEMLASTVNVNPVIIRKIIGMLKAAGLVTVEPGVGGAFLEKEPKDISLLDVYKAVEKDNDIFKLHENPNPECPVGKNIHRILGGKLKNAERAMLDYLESVTLQSLLEEMPNEQEN